MNLPKEEYLNNWIYRAREDISVMENLAKTGIEYYTSTICFHAQQAVEKYLKSFLIFHDVDFPSTHDVDFLLMECQKIDKVNFHFDFKSLTEFGVAVRYPDDFYVPEVDETKEYLDIALDVKKTVENLLNLL
ncbi:MAG TPA: HEPN domain-containing protein [Bacteroidales bacterium]|nr:HEPN domain-containing protein [Bacteroidales bacterium]